MASLPTPPNQVGQFNPSYHTPTSTHHQQQPAPIACMEPNNPSTASTVAKRGPQDEYQLGSAHPAKKGRGSQQHTSLEVPEHQQQHVPDTSPLPPLSHGLMGPEPPNHPDQTMLNRGVSMPPPHTAMENFVFPGSSGTAPSQTSRSSPMLSPKQLAPPVLPTPGGFNTSMQPSRDFHVPWGMSALYPQPSTPMPPPPLPPASQSITSVSPSMAALHRSILNPSPAPVQTSNEQAPSRPQSPKKPDQVGEPETTDKTQATATTPAPKITPPPSANNGNEHSAAQALTSDPSSHTGLQSPAPTAHIEPNEAGQSQAMFSQAVPGLQPAQTQMHGHGPKAPCLVCDQMRQQMLFNQANGIPSSQHNPHMGHHPWHGQSAVPSMQQHFQMQPGGYGMSPSSMPQGLQSRYQPVAHGQPMPMSYLFPQMPYQMPVQLQQQQVQQRNVNTPTASESMSSGLQQTPNNVGQSAQFANPISQPHFTQTQFLPPQMTMAAPMSAAQQAPQSSNPASPATHQQPSALPTVPTTQVQPEARKYSPNLIVDIAETCEELFPWDEVAKRHNVPRSKVTETFSAIIQLPLLRCTTDKKKHGQLATNRLREYTKAKKTGDAPTAGALPSTSSSSSPATTTAPASTIIVAPVHSQNQPQMTAQLAPNQDRPYVLSGMFDSHGLPTTMNGFGGPWQR